MWWWNIFVECNWNLKSKKIWNTATLAVFSILLILNEYLQGKDQLTVCTWKYAWVCLHFPLRLSTYSVFFGCFYFCYKWNSAHTVHEFVYLTGNWTYVCMGLLLCWCIFNRWDEESTFIKSISQKLLLFFVFLLFYLAAYFRFSLFLYCVSSCALFFILVRVS